MNSDFARLWVGLAPEPQSDGSVMHPTVFCERQRRDWKCEESSNRHLAMTATVNNLPQKFDVSLPPKFEVTEVEPLLLLAIQTAQMTIAKGDCGDHCEAPPDTHSQQWIDGLNVAFRFDGKAKSIEINQDADGIFVVFDDYVLAFKRNALDPRKFEFKDWWQQVVVT